jgi:hypothetical protein
VVRDVVLGVVSSLALMFPGASWAADALIVHDGTPGIEADVLANLTTKLVTAGYAVTPAVGVPGGALGTYSQIWDVRYNNPTPLSAGDRTAYLTYLQGGGSLFVMGENTGFMTRDNSIVSLITSAGGGTIAITTPNNTQTVRAPFTGPNAISTVTFQAAAGTANPGRGTFITTDGRNSAAIVYPPGTLTNAPNGSLIAVFDVNFLQAGADANLQAFSANLIAYLAAPSPVAAMVPVPPSLILVLAGGAGAALFGLRRRRRPGRLSLRLG